MPARLSEAGRLAQEHGITYACAKYRLENGLPLDAPVKHGNPEKAWKTRRKPAWARRALNPFVCMVVR